MRDDNDDGDDDDGDEFQKAFQAKFPFLQPFAQTWLGAKSCREAYRVNAWHAVVLQEVCDELEAQPHMTSIILGRALALLAELVREAVVWLVVCGVLHRRHIGGWQLGKTSDGLACR